MAEENWPFINVNVDHLFYGTTRIWWSLYDTFNDPGPHRYQLQAGYTDAPSALDWINIGSVATNAFYLDDESGRERYGNVMLTHYRVVLTTATGRYTSQPRGIFGTLTREDWRLATEILRKEALLMEKVGRPGYLLHRMRYGITSKSSTDPLTGEIIDSDNAESYGTEFQVGYHPPVAMSVDVQVRQRKESRGIDPQTFSGDIRKQQAKVIGFRMLNKGDIWVDATTDERWEINGADTTGAIRGVPLLQVLDMSMIPFNNVVYKIPVTSLSQDPTADAKTQPSSGTGCVSVDHDYPVPGDMLYQDGGCCGIAGATIQVFTKADWDANRRDSSFAVATSMTAANGIWSWQVKLEPGDYVARFERVPDFGPDTVELTVGVPEPPPSSIELISSESFSTPITDVSDLPPAFVDRFGQF